MVASLSSLSALSRWFYKYLVLKICSLENILDSHTLEWSYLESFPVNKTRNAAFLKEDNSFKLSMVVNLLERA